MSEFPPPGFVPGPSAIPGIEVYMPQQSREKRPDVVDFKCPKCGATIAYQVEEGGLFCEHCGYSETPESLRLGPFAEQFEFDTHVVARSQQGWGAERRDLACQRCGAVVSLPKDTLAYSCPFCGSNKVLYREPLEDMLRPRFLIPFKLSPKECREAVVRWLGNNWLLPDELRSAALERFNPIYIPYWTFDAVCNATWHARVGQTETTSAMVDGERVEYNKTRWRDETGKVQKGFNDLLVPGTTRLNLRTLAKVDHFKLADLILYEPRYLAGMQAQAYDVPLEEAWEAGRQILRERTRGACLDRINSSTVDSFRMTLDFSDERWRYILVPVYTSLYRYGDKTFQILINGQTGKIAGPRPVDWGRFWATIVTLLAPGVASALSSLVTTGNQSSFLGGLGVFLLAVGVVFSYFILRQAMEMENA